MVSLSIIGSGNIAHHLICAFKNNSEVQLMQVFSRNKNHSLPIGSYQIVNDLDSLKKVDVIIIAVSDQAIEALSVLLPNTNSLVLHTSGGSALEILDIKNRRGVFYPLQTFSKNKKISFEDIPICIEAENEDDYMILEKIGSSISKNVLRVASLQRKSMHIAAVFVSNFVNHLYKIGSDICIEHDLPFQILEPLIAETANKIKFMKPSDAQTGPAKRQDFQTIAQHLKSLKHSDKKHLYETLTQSIIQNG